jgi:hypothetical protein
MATRLERLITGIGVLALVVGTASAAAAQESGSGRRDTIPLRLHPGAAAQLIDEVGGRLITLPRAKVVSVLGPQALLVESAGPLDSIRGGHNRVVVLIERGALHVDAADLIGATVQVTGLARTVLGMQVSREVPWPPELTRDIVRRYEIRAAVLSSSVQTADGVQLVTAAAPEGAANER